MYYLETCYAGNTIEVCRYHSPYCRPKGTKRNERTMQTSEEQQRVNERQAEKKLRRIINTNFVPGDYHLVLSYSKENRPEDAEAMKKDIQRFHRRIRGECKKRNIAYKFIHVSEIGSKGAMHHHLVINQLPPEVLREAWTKGRIHIALLDDSGQYSELASYLIKYSSRQLQDKDRLQGKRWNASRNLKKPKITKQKITSSTFRSTPKERQGYYIDRNMSYEFVDAAGYRNMQTMYIKLRKRE